MRAFWLMLFAIGAVVVLVSGWRGGEPWTAAAFVAFFAYRVPREEQMRLDDFGDDYAAYVKRTHRLWPLLCRSL